MTLASVFRPLAIGLGTMTIATFALADSLSKSPPPPKIYSTECSSCHIAFPAGLMTAGDWATTLKELPRHFGTDASVSPAELAALSAYLGKNAAASEDRYGSTVKPPRLTKSSWFERKHVRKLPADAWTNPKVKTASNCIACHLKADQGSYSERDISVPGYPGRHW